MYVERDWFFLLSVLLYVFGKKRYSACGQELERQIYRHTQTGLIVTCLGTLCSHISWEGEGSAIFDNISKLLSVGRLIVISQDRFGRSVSKPI